MATKKLNKTNDLDEVGRWTMGSGKKAYTIVKVPDANKKAIAEINKKKKGK